MNKEPHTYPAARIASARPMSVTGSDFDTVSVAGLSDADLKALRSMSGGYSVDVAVTIVYELESGLTPYQIAQKYRRKEGFSKPNVYRYCQALPYRKGRGRK